MLLASRILIYLSSGAVSFDKLFYVDVSKLSTKKYFALWCKDATGERQFDVFLKMGRRLAVMIFGMQPSGRASISNDLKYIWIMMG